MLVIIFTSNKALNILRDKNKHWLFRTLIILLNLQKAIQINVKKKI